jgi:hypothetical protein
MADGKEQCIYVKFCSIRKFRNMQHWLEAFSYEALSQCKDIPVGFGV